MRSPEHTEQVWHFADMRKWNCFETHGREINDPTSKPKNRLSPFFVSSLPYSVHLYHAGFVLLLLFLSPAIAIQMSFHRSDGRVLREMVVKTVGDLVAKRGERRKTMGSEISPWQRLRATALSKQHYKCPLKFGGTNISEIMRMSLHSAN